MSRIVLLGCWLTCQSIAVSVVAAQEKPAPGKPKVQRTDADGLPLPAGAVARLGTLRGVHDSPIGFLALSPDGKKVATVPAFPQSPTLRIRAVPSCKLLQEVPLKMKFWENMALSPDFKKLAWTYLDNSVAIIDLATGKETVLNAATEDARRAAITLFDGKRIIVTFSHHLLGQAPTRKGDKDKQKSVSLVDFEIVEWTLADGKKRLLAKTEKDDYGYRHMAFSPDGKVRAHIKKKTAEKVADFEQEFVLQDAAGQERLRLPLKDGADCLMEFSPDGPVLALADDESLRLIDLAENKVRWTAVYGDKIRRPKSRYESPIPQPWPAKLVWLHGGNVGVFFHPGDLWTWKIADGAPARSYTSQAAEPLAAAREALVLAFAQDGQTLQFLDTSSGKPMQPVAGHRNPPQVLFRKDGSLVSHDPWKICHWSAGDWRLLTSFEFQDRGQRYHVGASQDFFVRTAGNKLEARSLKNGAIVKEWMLKSAADYVYLLSDGKTVAAGYLEPNDEKKAAERQCVRLLDVVSGTEKEIPLAFQPIEVRASAVRPELALRYRQDSRECIDVLDAVSGKLRRLVENKEKETTFTPLLDFAADGKRLHFSIAGETLASVAIDSGTIASHGTVGRINESAITADGRYLIFSPRATRTTIVGGFGRISSTPSREVILWDRVFETERSRFDNTGAWVRSVSCSPDVRYLAAGLYDTTILIWDFQALTERK